MGKKTREILKRTKRTEQHRFTGDFMHLGEVDGRKVVFYRVFDEDRDAPLFTGCGFEDEITPLIRHQVELMARAVGYEAQTMDLNAMRDRGTPA